MKNNAFEVNFDGLVGPTHNYCGLSYGNVASQNNQFSVSNPREAALQGLEKMKLLADKGIKQGILPPQMRPHIPTLRKLGFSGTDLQILETAAKQSPELLLAVSSAAAMWTANAATISPSPDTTDGKVHLTAANLASKFHRSIEAEATSKILKTIFFNEKYFVHHEPLPHGTYFADEGAANHTRLCNGFGDPGLELFIYGRQAFQPNTLAPKRFPARQTLEASQAIARAHGLPTNRTIFAQQHPAAIDAGAFHNDVVAVGNQNVLLFHEQAFLNKEALLHEIETKANALAMSDLYLLQVSAKDISLQDAIDSYLFNSQLITLPNNQMILVSPFECQQKEHIKAYIDMLVNSSSNPISNVVYINLHQSMRNGGGPACLRIRATLQQDEFDALNPSFIFNDSLYQKLKTWIHKHYRDRLDPKDLASPQLFNETTQALNELQTIFSLPMSY